MIEPGKVADTNRLAVGDNTSADTASEVSVNINLGLGEVNELLDEGSIFWGSAQEVGILPKAGN